MADSAETHAESLAGSAVPAEGHGESVVRLLAGQMLIVLWGVLGIVAFVGQAIVRLTPLALEPLQRDMMSSLQWGLYIGWCFFNGYAEGYRGFQRSFSPRVVARAVHLARHPKPLYVLLAPIFCMALFHARRRKLIVSWCLLIGIVILIMLVSLLPQPWRGIVDAGVVVGLVWGNASLLWLLLNALVRGRVPQDAALPES